MKVGYTVTFHHSDEIRPNGKKVLRENIESLYASCDKDFTCFVIDNQYPTHHHHE